EKILGGNFLRGFQCVLPLSSRRLSPGPGAHRFPSCSCSPFASGLTTGLPPLQYYPQEPPSRETSATEGRASMPIVKVIELVGESPHSWEDAAQVAVREAAKTIRNITGVEVLNWTGNVDERGNIVEYKADVQVAFVVEGHE